MLSLYSNHSNQCQSKQNVSLNQIYHKSITKQKMKTLQIKNKSEQSLILTYQNNRKLKQQTNKIKQIKSKDLSINLNRSNLTPLGRLFIDEFTINSVILERKITPQFVEFKLQPTNFFDEENGLPQIISIYQNELLQFYNRFSVQTQQLNERKKYEDSLNCPYECIRISFSNNKLIKISKKWNYDFLRMMGINQQIIDDYIFKHKILPKCWDLCKILSINGESYFTTNIINYQGERFVSNVQIKAFMEQNQSTQTREQLIYVTFQCERIFLNVEKIQANFQHYFNLQQLPPDWYYSIHKSRSAKRCSFRNKAK